MRLLTASLAAALLAHGCNEHVTPSSSTAAKYLTELNSKRPEIDRCIQEYRFDDAFAAVAAIESAARADGIIGTPTNKAIDEEFVRIGLAKQEHEEKVRNGYVMFEGKLISPDKRQQILEGRQRAAEEKQAADLAKQRRQREAALAAQHGREARRQQAEIEAAKLAEQQRSQSFRKAAWGMSMAEVVASEGREPDQRADGLLIYKDRIDQFDCHAGFVFVADQLVRGTYLIGVEHVNDTLYLSDYAELKDLLTKKYGKPEEDETIWLNDLYRDDPADWGRAIAVGHLAQYTIWQTQSTTIHLALQGDNFDVSLRIEYVSKAHQGLEEQHRRSSALDDL